MEKRLKLKIFNNKTCLKIDIIMLTVNLIGVIFKSKFNILAWNVGMFIVVIAMRVCEFYVEKRNGSIHESED